MQTLHRTTIPRAVGALAVTAAAVLLTSAPPAIAQSASAPAATAPMRAASARLDRADSAFITQAAPNGLAEVAASVVAIGKATDTRIRGFAQQMIDDHKVANQALAALAASKGVKMPDEPSMTQRAKIKLLDARSGDGFDKAYASSWGVEAHEETVKLFRKAAAEAKDPDVKAFAASTLPKLEGHLKMAQELKAATTGDATSRTTGQPKS